VLLLAAVSYQFDLGTRWFGWEYPSPVTAPAEVAPPPGLTLPKPAAAAVVAPESATRPVDPAAVRRAVARLVASKKLGRSVAVRVDQLDGDKPVYEHGPALVTPASTMKLLTTTAALQALGPDHRFRTRVVAQQHAKRIVLVGGGDPLLARRPVTSPADYPAEADIGTLARSTAKALKAVGRTKVRLGYDTSLFRGPAVNPAWPASYLTDSVVSRISPLWVDEGRTAAGSLFRSRRPAEAAAAAFAARLEAHKITVVGAPQPRTAAAGDQELAAVRSAPLREIVQHILELSDNEGAEILLRQVAVAEGEPASFEGGVRAVNRVLGRLGVDTTGETHLDGSGLSRRNRVHTSTLMSVLELAASPAHPGLRAVVANLPVAGFTGSLAYRFLTGDRAGLGLVRAKTGTLTGVHGLAGVATTVDGTVLMFVAVADRVPLADTLSARAKLDQIAAALAGCTCAAGGASASPEAGPSASPTP
jgi:D-alanyl-D-alanine carboxypeptidase/D-alanyl-D-alanine-endopeptidase (penicillin-binding protein 4)